MMKGYDLHISPHITLAIIFLNVKVETLCNYELVIFSKTP